MSKAQRLKPFGARGGYLEETPSCATRITARTAPAHQHRRFLISDCQCSGSYPMVESGRYTTSMPSGRSRLAKAAGTICLLANQARRLRTSSALSLRTHIANDEHDALYLRPGPLGKRVLTALLVHNRYQQAGGEDTVFAAEAEMLRRCGHRVIQYTRRNDEIDTARWLTRVHLAARTIWARDSYRAVRELVRRERPQVAHFHNTFPLISPSGYYACHDAGVPVVQTLHNYRLLCPVATFLRDGKICEACLGRSVPWPGVLYGCYRSSRAATAVVAAMLAFHRSRNTWTGQVDYYIALTEFSRQKFIQGGLPADRM